MNNITIPQYVLDIISKLEDAGFEAYIVGGCVRDLLLNASTMKPFDVALFESEPQSRGQGSLREPKDWDITTNARPEDILKVFPRGKYENDFGTVLIPVRESGIGNRETGINVVEVTTYRSEQGYSDRRHPDEVRFEDELEKDLERRDFTINAMALRPGSGQTTDDRRQTTEIIDLFGGEKDIKKRVIRAVGEPSDRFKEDALRMMRAIRFACQLNFEIEPKTQRAITKLAGNIKFISNERIRDELIKILSTNKAYDGIKLLYETKLLNYILPELLKGVNVKQDRHHIYPVFEHSILSLKFCPSADWRVRLACLLHDIGKPQTRVIRDGIATFYNHEYVGAKIVDKIVKRLKFSNEDADKIVTLVRYHMFYYDTEEVTAASVRRLIAKVGKENLKDIINVRIGDRLGSGTPKAKPYKLRHLEYMFDRVQNDPVNVKMLKINGADIMNVLKIQPGPKIGAINDVLLSEVIEDPRLNTKEALEKRVVELNEFDLEELRKKAKSVIEDKRAKDDQQMKKGHWV